MPHHHAVRRYPTLYEAVFERANSLNFLRLVLASFVILSHTPYIVMGAKVDAHPLLHEFYVFGDFAVNAFFCISGFLIAHSAYRSGAGSYLVKRVLRIFPGFWASLLFVVAIGGPLSILTGHAATGWNWADAISYIRRNYDLMALQYPLFGGPANVPFDSPSWNGSVWTLEYEFFCYLLLLPLFYLPFVRKHLKVFIPLAYAISLSYYLCNQYVGYDFMSQAFGMHPRDLNASARLYPFFFAGSLLYMLSRRIKIYPIISAVAAVVCTAAGFYFTWLVPHANIMQWTQLILAYGVITLGCVMNIPLGRTNDISYGVYIYAWPVQQILVLLGSVSLGLAANIALDVVLTFGVAWLSWKLVEKPAMNLARHPVVTGAKRAATQSAAAPCAPKTPEPEPQGTPAAADTNRVKPAAHPVLPPIR